MSHDPVSSRKSRRWFLTGGLTQKAAPKEMVKMLTPDGKLVEVEKAILDQATQRVKATTQDIYQWMQNPSKADDKPSH